MRASRLTAAERGALDRSCCSRLSPPSPSSPTTTHSAICPHNTQVHVVSQPAQPH